jgi:hypothetical protein
MKIQNPHKARGLEKAGRRQNQVLMVLPTVSEIQT